jgi:hypothetical protein
MDADQRAFDFVFPMTANQPVWFRASDGVGSIQVPPFPNNVTREETFYSEGELKCWAIKELPDPSNPTRTLETQISWNYLYGTAMLLESFVPWATEYTAFAFAARNVAFGGAVITPPDTGPGTLVLNGSFTDIGYDACPAYLNFNFFPEGASVDPPTTDFVAGISDLALSPCKQDFRQDNGPICTKAKFDIWNENEIKFTGAYQCIKCWFEGILSEIGSPNQVWRGCKPNPAALESVSPNVCTKPTGVGGKRFLASSLKTEIARFRVSPDTFAACTGVFRKLGPDGKTVVDVCGDAFNQYKTPFLGVLFTGLTPGLDGAVKQGFDDIVIGSMPATAGAWVAGAPAQPIPGIMWDPGVGTISAPGR